MVTIKKISILVILGSLFLTFAVAETRVNSFSVSPTVGILYGQAEELVYKYPNSDQYMSELLWDIKPLFCIGITADFGPHDPFRQNGFIAALSFKYGIPLKTGMLENRDWVSPSHNDLTHFSWHDANSRGAFLLDISAGYSWSINDFLAITAYGEFTFNRFSWSGKDGQYMLPPTSNIPQGEVIRYTQNWFILAPGLSLKWKPSLLFSLEGNFNYTPLIYCHARDDHFLRKHLISGDHITFFDYLFWGHYLKGGGEFAFSPVKKLDFLLNISYTFMTGTRGYTLVRGFREAEDAGAGYSALGFGIAVRLRPFDRN